MTEKTDSIKILMEENDRLFKECAKLGKEIDSLLAELKERLKK